MTRGSGKARRPVSEDAMRRLQAEIERLRGQNREIAKSACDTADVLSSRLTPALLRDAQMALRQNLLYVERRLSRLDDRRKRRSAVLGRRFTGTPYFRECRGIHVALLQQREDLLAWQRNLLRQVGDTFAWMVLRRDPNIIGALYARRSHSLPTLEGLLGPAMLSDDAHTSGALLVIDNDLTRCLGTGDLTVVSNDHEWVRPLVVEVKSTLSEEGHVDINAFGPSANDASDRRLYALLNRAFRAESDPPHDVSLQHQKQRDDMLDHVKVLHASMARQVQSAGGASAIRWRTLENVLSKALQNGGSADIVDGVAYLAVRAREDDKPGDELVRLRDFLRQAGVSPTAESTTSGDFQERDFLSALLPPIPLWRLSHAVRVSILSGDLFFATCYKPSIWEDAFGEYGITLTSEKGGWRITKDGQTLMARARDVVALRYAVALIGMSHRQVVMDVARLFERG